MYINQLLLTDREIETLKGILHFALQQHQTEASEAEDEMVRNGCRISANACRNLLDYVLERPSKSKRLQREAEVRVHQIATDYAQDGQREVRVLLDDPVDPEFDSESAPCALMDVDSTEEIFGDTLDTYGYEDIEIPETVIRRIIQMQTVRLVLMSQGLVSDVICVEGCYAGNAGDILKDAIKRKGAKCFSSKDAIEALTKAGYTAYIDTSAWVLDADKEVG